MPVWSLQWQYLWHRYNTLMWMIEAKSVSLFIDICRISIQDMPLPLDRCGSHLWDLLSLHFTSICQFLDGEEIRHLMTPFRFMEWYLSSDQTGTLGRWRLQPWQCCSKPMSSFSQIPWLWSTFPLRLAAPLDKRLYRIPLVKKCWLVINTWHFHAIHNCFLAYNFFYIIYAVLYSVMLDPLYIYVYFLLLKLESWILTSP